MQALVSGPGALACPHGRTSRGFKTENVAMTPMVRVTEAGDALSQSCTSEPDLDIDSPCTPLVTVDVKLTWTVSLKQCNRLTMPDGTRHS